MTEIEILIHRYITQQLSEKERQSVAARMDSDPDFKQLVVEEQILQQLAFQLKAEKEAKAQQAFQSALAKAKQSNITELPPPTIERLGQQIQKGIELTAEQLAQWFMPNPFLENMLSSTFRSTSSTASFQIQTKISVSTDEAPPLLHFSCTHAPPLPISLHITDNQTNTLFEFQYDYPAQEWTVPLAPLSKWHPGRYYWQITAVDKKQAKALKYPPYWLGAFEVMKPDAER